MRPPKPQLRNPLAGIQKPSAKPASRIAPGVLGQQCLSLYVNALYSSGKLTVDRALEMLQEGLRLNPNDAGVYFRIADILSDLPDKADDALRYSEEAAALGHQKAVLTSAKILLNKGRVEDARKRLHTFVPQSERDKVILDVLLARSLRDKPDEARTLLKGYSKGSNPFIDNALIEIEIASAEHAMFSQDYDAARRFLEKAGMLVEDAKVRYKSQNLQIFLGSETQILSLRRRLPDS